MLIIDNALEPALVHAAQGLLADPALFEDGKATAGWAAKTVKANLQARSDPRVAGLGDKVAAALLAHPVVRAAAQPKTIVRLGFSRYETGMAYGRHVDEALIDGQRTDLSFTLFLSPPEAYEGGALLIVSPQGEEELRLKPGAAVLYPTSAVHEVTPMTRGVRLAAFGWIRSFIRDPAARECLFDLEIAARAEFERGGKSEAFDRLTRVKAQLVRMWAED